MKSTKHYADKYRQIDQAHGDPHGGGGLGRGPNGHHVIKKQLAKHQKEKKGGQNGKQLQQPEPLPSGGFFEICNYLLEDINFCMAALIDRIGRANIGEPDKQIPGEFLSPSSGDKQKVTADYLNKYCRHQCVGDEGQSIRLNPQQNIVEPLGSMKQGAL